MKGTLTHSARAVIYVLYIYRSRRSCKGQALSDFSTPTPTDALVLQVAIEPFSAARRSKLGPVLCCLVSLHCRSTVRLCVRGRGRGGGGGEIP